MSEEQRLLQRIDEALEDAVKSLNLNWSKATRIKRQKYTEQAIEHFSSDDDTYEAPVTRSWFKYGGTQSQAPSGSDRLDFPEPETPESLSGPTLDDYDDGEEAHPETKPDRSEVSSQGSPRKDPIFEVSENDFMMFFIDRADAPPLDRVHWEMKDLEFLKEYYEENAPPGLKELYLANVELRQVLRDARDDLKEIHENRATLYTEGHHAVPNLKEKQYYERAGQAAVQLRLAMRKHEELFDASIGPVSECTDLIENVLMQLQMLPPTEIVPPHSRIVQELSDFYDSTVWLLPAYEMSEHTAEGPHKEVLKQIADANYNTILSGRNDDDPGKFEEEIDQIRRECASYNLLPRPSDFPSESHENSQDIDEMMNIIDSPDTDE
ncbi:hypothetical protein [Salinigranum rubrum]|uniref:hypothetical protein n=1 Tax=Salinigranum rubrum TaxID=755307 RepID=UPI0013A57CA8|nr:hypothetical protein [Salinigranum rubrum]